MIDLGRVAENLLTLGILFGIGWLIYRKWTASSKGPDFFEENPIKKLFGGNLIKRK